MFILLYDFPQIPAVSAYTLSSFCISFLFLLPTQPFQSKSFPGACHFVAYFLAELAFQRRIVYTQRMPAKTFYGRHSLAC